MAQENKELLLKDLSARLLYGVKVQINSDVKKVVGVKNGFVVTKERGLYSTKEYITRIECCIPYLRPMSSMTDVEKHIFDTMTRGYTVHQQAALFDWLNAHYFDYRGLIEKGLAIEAHEGMYGKEEQQ